MVTVWSPFFARDASDAVSAGPTPSRGGTPSFLQTSVFGRLGGTGATGLEPATSGVTGRRSNQLSYAPVRPTVWHPPRGGVGRPGHACPGARQGICSDMYIGIGTLIIIIILLIILL